MQPWWTWKNPILFLLTLILSKTLWCRWEGRKNLGENPSWRSSIISPNGFIRNPITIGHNSDISIYKYITSTTLMNFRNPNLIEITFCSRKCQTYVWLRTCYIVWWGQKSIQCFGALTPRHQTWHAWMIPEGKAFLQSMKQTNPTWFRSRTSPPMPFDSWSCSQDFRQHALITSNQSSIALHQNCCRWEGKKMLKSLQ